MNDDKDCQTAQKPDMADGRKTHDQSTAPYGLEEHMNEEQAKRKSLEGAGQPLDSSATIDRLEHAATTAIEDGDSALAKKLSKAADTIAKLDAFSKPLKS